MPLTPDSPDATSVDSLDWGEKPADVVGAAGAWLAAQLAVKGFAWTPSLQKLERRRGTRKEQIDLQSSKWNRTGADIAASAVLNVRDIKLKAWRRAHPELTLYEGTSDDWLCGHPLGVLTGSFAEGAVELGDATRRSTRLEAFLQTIRTTALPWFAQTTDPLNIADIAKVTIDLYAIDLVEFLVCHGDRDQAVELVRVWLTRHPDRQLAFVAGRELARTGGRPNRNTPFEALGWTSTVLNLG